MFPSIQAEQHAKAYYEKQPTPISQPSSVKYVYMYVYIYIFIINQLYNELIIIYYIYNHVYSSAN